MRIVFQSIFFLFACFAIGTVISKRREGVLGIMGTSFWVCFWLIAAIAVFLPTSITLLANYLGIGRGTDFVFYVSLITIFYILFKLHVKVEMIARDVTKVVRREALFQETIKQ